MSIHGEFRQHIELGRRQEVNGSIDRHVDGAAFWRKSYDKAEIAQAELRAKIHELERRNEVLSSKLKPPEAASINSITQGKRKRGNEESADAAAENPAKQANPSCREDGSLVHLPVGQLELSSPLAYAGSYMLLTYQLHSQLRRRKFNPSELSSILIHLASSMYAVALATCEKYRDRVTLTTPNTSAPARSPHVDRISSMLQLHHETTSTFRALERTFCHLLEGLDKMTKDLVGKRSQGLLVYNFVKLFADVFALISTMSLCLAEQQMAIEKQRPRKRTQKGNKHAKEPISNSRLPSTEDDIRSHISRLVIAMITELQPAQAAHCDILEGFLYVLLNRTGQVLDKFVFKEPEGEDLSSQPRNLPSRAIGQDQANEAQQRANRGESCHLVWILESSLASVQQNPPGDCAQARDPSKDLRNSMDRIKSARGGLVSKELLPERAKTRLQNTLLRGMFGDDGKRFHDCFRKPTNSKPIPKMPTITRDGDDTEDWFKGQIWRLLGWEILSKDLDPQDPSSRESHIKDIDARQPPKRVAVRR
ncbi:MAG: hypothetical protein M1812_004106 [Candelaria pacifica]|nr:MAG: hypothetical protein M1812_004106 [Candelaria pacifica]